VRTRHYNPPYIFTFISRYTRCPGSELNFRSRLCSTYRPQKIFNIPYRSFTSSHRDPPQPIYLIMSSSSSTGPAAAQGPDNAAVQAQQEEQLDVLVTSSLQSTFSLDRAREFLGAACDPQLRLVSRWFRQALADVPHQQLRVEDYFLLLNIFLWAREELRMPRGDKIAIKAALHGHLHILQWLQANNSCPLTIEVCYNAAEGGQLEVLQWLRAEDPPCPWDGIGLHNKK
jgi:hypothetical protein